MLYKFTGLRIPCLVGLAIRDAIAHSSSLTTETTYFLISPFVSLKRITFKWDGEEVSTF